MLDVDVAVVNSQAVFKLAKNSNQPSRNFFAATYSYLNKELVTGQSAKATLYPLLRDQV